MTLLHPHIQEFTPASRFNQRPSVSSSPKATTQSKPLEVRSRCLKVLGVSQEASQSQIDSAYKHLVADITPSPDANHSRVGIAQELLAEVEQAYSLLEAC